MTFCVGTNERGLTLKPNCKWDGDPNFLFQLTGKSDSDFAKDESGRSVSGWSTFLCGAPISMKSKMQTTTTLSVTEAELVAAVTCAQDLLFEKRVLESIGLQVELPMILEVDNKGVVDLANNWSIGGRTRHITVRTNFLRELKEEGLLKVVWIPTERNSSDLFTKNLQGPLFERHAGEYVSEMFSMDSQGEGVGGQDLSHETLGTETVESHQEPGVGLEENNIGPEEYANGRHEPTVNEMEGYGSKMKATNKNKNEKVANTNET
jgi:hypothetical protein